MWRAASTSSGRALRSPGDKWERSTCNGALAKRLAIRCSSGRLGILAALRVITITAGTHARKTRIPAVYHTQRRSPAEAVRRKTHRLFFALDAERFGER